MLGGGLFGGHARTRSGRGHSVHVVIHPVVCLVTAAGGIRLLGVSASTAASTSPTRRRAAVSARSAAFGPACAGHLGLGDGPPALQLGEFGLDPVQLPPRRPSAAAPRRSASLGAVLVGSGACGQLPVQRPAALRPLGPRPPGPPSRLLGAPPASAALGRLGPESSAAPSAPAGDQPQPRPGHLAEPGVRGRPDQPPGAHLLGDLRVGQRRGQRLLHLGQRQLAASAPVGLDGQLGVPR